jgi:hypothetical protein
MWKITSNDVQRAKDQLQLRRAEIDTKYAEEKRALDAELAVIETLERAASDFMLRHGRENAEIASEPAAQIGPLSGGEESSGREDVRAASEPAAPIDAFRGNGESSSADAGTALQPAAETDPPPSGGELSGGLDILKPGSRWRLYRGTRPTDPEGLATDASSTTG